MGERISSCCTIYGFSSACFLSVAIVGEMEYRYIVSFFVDEDEGGERIWKKEVCSRIRRRKNGQ